MPDKKVGLLYYGLGDRFVNGLLAHARGGLDPRGRTDIWWQAKGVRGFSLTEALERSNRKP
jgi:hypothetical protein